MTDKELLELAAKAAGIEIKWATQIGNGVVPDEVFSMGWNPLKSDADALRLAVKLGIDIVHYENASEAIYYKKEVYGGLSIEESHGDDPYAATRRCITRAAAEIGKTL